MKSEMATFVEFLNLCFSQCVSILVTGAITIAAFYILSKTAEAFYSRTYRESKTESNSCSSPTCLRCQSRLAGFMGCKKEELLMKLQHFELKTKTNQRDLTRLYKAIESDSTMESLTDPLQQPTVFYLDTLTPQVAWHDDSSYNSELESLALPESVQTIKAEFLALYADHSESWIRNSVPTGAWRVCHLYNQGKKVDKNCIRCPRTTKILENLVPFARECAFGNALFSVMLAETHITAHCGPTNCRLRCHLPLIVPGNCGLKVNGEQRAWNEGQPLLFDDSFLHEAWNRGTQNYRAVLMVDLWHPGLSETEQDALKCLFPM